MVFKLGENSSFSVRGVDTGGIIYFHYWGLTYTVYWVAKSGGIVFIIFCSLIDRINSLYIQFLYVLCIIIVLLWEYINIFFWRKLYLDFYFYYSLELEDLNFHKNKILQYMFGSIITLCRWKRPIFYPC